MTKKIDEYLNFLNSGKLSFDPFLVLEGKGRVFPEYTFSINEKAKCATLSTIYDGIIKDNLYISFDERQMICKRTTENISKENIDLCEIGVRVADVSFGEDSSKDYYYHVDNPRSHMKMIRYVDSVETTQAGEFDEQAGTAWFTESDSTDRVGASPNQPFTAILISNTNTNKGLVHGTLSQDVYFHSYATSKNNGATVCDIFSSFKCIHALTFEPERILVDEWYMGRTEEADDYEKIFNHYTEVLRTKLPKNFGLAKINRDNLVWGSWNDGLFRDVSEELLLKEARFLKDNFPTVKWFQLDDGYAVYNKSAHGIGVPYEGDDGIDKEKFPEGLRSYADKIREIGLRPALWIGDWCPRLSKIGQEKKEFVVDSELLDEQVKNSGLLDVSKPEVREYMQKAVKILVNKYGFDGVKLDFWTYPFETTSGAFPLKKATKSVYSSRTQSGYEYRRWWLDQIRQVLPGDGYLQTCCAIGMGNPFLGEFATNYRYGIDIGGGKWENVKTCYLWGIACVATHTGDIFVPNSDSIGLLPGLSDTDAMFWINFCLVTHTMVEIAGLLSNAPKDDKLKHLKKAACNPNNGQDVYFVNFDYRNESKNVPTIMYFKTPHFSTRENSDCMPVRTVGIFNLEEETTVERFTVKDLGLKDGKYIITNVWTGEQKEFDDSFEISMGAHDSALFAVSCADGVQVYDANIRMLDAVACDKAIIIATDYAEKEAEIIVNKKVSEILFDGEKIAFTQNGDKVIFNLPGKGELKLIIG